MIHLERKVRGVFFRSCTNLPPSRVSGGEAKSGWRLMRDANTHLCSFPNETPTILYPAVERAVVLEKAVEVFSHRKAMSRVLACCGRRAGRRGVRFACFTLSRTGPVHAVHAVQTRWLDLPGMRSREAWRACQCLLAASNVAKRGRGLRDAGRDFWGLAAA